MPCFRTLHSHGFVLRASSVRHETISGTLLSFNLPLAVLGMGRAATLRCRLSHCARELRPRWLDSHGRRRPRDHLPPGRIFLFLSMMRCMLCECLRLPPAAAALPGPGGPPPPPLGAAGPPCGPPGPRVSCGGCWPRRARSCRDTTRGCAAARRSGINSGLYGAGGGGGTDCPSAFNHSRSGATCLSPSPPVHSYFNLRQAATEAAACVRNA